MLQNHRLMRLLLLLPLLALAGCASVNGPTEPQDPYEGFNRSMYTFNDKVDKAVAKPVAEVYRDYTPHAIRAGINNFFSNLDDVLVTVNDLLQAKGNQAASDFSRFIWNSTAGLLGTVDVASAMNMPKHDEDFGQTLGYWGAGPGPYLVLPLIGPSDVRDGVGTVAYWYTDPLYLAEKDSDVYWPAVILRGVDQRAQLLSATNVLEQAALDPYVFTREAYLQLRRAKVYDGKPPPASDNPFDQEFDPTAPDGDLPPEEPAPAPATPPRGATSPGT